MDQPGHLSSLLFAVAREMGLEVGFITPKAMARGIDLYGGEAKTDKRDSFLIADLALRIPSLVHGALTRYGNEEELAALMSFDRELRFCEESRVYYDRKRAEGRCHYSAVIALARRRINVVYAMLRDGQRFESRLG